MSCSFPLVAIKYKNIFSKTGKNYVKIVASLDSFKSDKHLDLLLKKSNLSESTFNSLCENLKYSDCTFKNDECEIFLVPCGKCLACRLAGAKEWADRCMLELRYHPSSYFVTLTYDDQHLPRSPNSGIPTLRKKDLQDFNKRLRSRLGYPIRYFASGEYGEHYHRPHYHSIIFGLQLDDLKPFLYSTKKSETYNGGYKYFQSDFLTDVWDRGLVCVGQVTYETCSYTARYVMKKALGFSKDIYNDLDIEPEFSLMSRRPGIARLYYDDNKYKFYDSGVFQSDMHRSYYIDRCRYFDKLFDVDDPEAMQLVKDKRISEINYDNSLSYEDYLVSKSRDLESRTKVLSRDNFFKFNSKRME